MNIRALFAAIAVASCGPSQHGTSDAGLCSDSCPAGQVCVTGLGCVACIPGNVYCDPADDKNILQCKDDGSGGDVYMTCAGNEACLNGTCAGACEAADGKPSSVGCHFYAVDLDNEAVKTQFGITNDAAAQQFSVAISNVNDFPVFVTITKNTAPFGQPPVEEMVKQVMINPNDLAQIDLPQREVDGTMGQNGTYAMDMTGTLGTFVSSHAYRIESTGPVVAVQFNPIIQQFSNDASLLLPKQALGMHHIVMGWPTSNPCGPPPGDPQYMQSIPDHTFVTIVGVEPNTTVTVVPAHPVKASAGPSGVTVAQTPRGTPMHFTIGPYDVVNLESDQPQVSIFDCTQHLDQDGDFSGTTVTSDKPVMVFSGNERGNGTGGADPPPPPDWNNETCCTDHLEEQLLPIEAWGWKYAVSRSPVRSTGGYEEPDLYRVLAQQNGTQITTSLPAPFDHFTLDAGKQKTIYAYTGFTIEATGGAIQVGQYLVSQDLTSSGIGDPSFTVFPAIDQMRDHYVFMVPTTFQDNYMVVVMPVGASVDLDNQSEFPPACDTRSVGTIESVTYKQVTCRLDPGTHRITTSQPAALYVYGYYNVGSYAFVGGSNVNIINPIL